MTKRAQAKYKISRRLGVNLWGRGKDPVNSKAYPPGQHGAAQGQGRKKTSDYGNQLRAKQQLKGYYANISEKQFRAIYQEAHRGKGDTSETMIGLLERRLDAVVYRMNFVPTMFSARQFISHKHVKVNGKTVNIPSYRVKEGDVVEVKEKSQSIALVIEAGQSSERSVPDYMEVDQKAYKGKFVRTPKLSEVPYPVIMQPNLVVEYYSR